MNRFKVTEIKIYYRSETLIKAQLIINKEFTINLISYSGGQDIKIPASCDLKDNYYSEKQDFAHRYYSLDSILDDINLSDEEEVTISSLKKLCDNVDMIEICY